MSHTHVHRPDNNQKAIVTALTKIGASVTITSGLGDGFPDLVCGYHGRNYLFECKESPHSPLTEKERKWHDTWNGTVYIVCIPEKAVEIVRDDLQEMQY